ncbi:MAG: DUF3419 family protein [Clostridiales bacterium]|nr:DUF3419 family protein [Clostridiales bacterium]
MITEEDKEYIYDKDYNVALGRVCEEFGYEYEDFNTTANRVYPFSNENICDSLKDINLDGKSVITVGSSGDQVLNSILKGANEITLIDGNPVARFYVELKLSAIRNLSFEEFLKYFRRKNVLNPKYYSKISHDLSPKAKEFWDTLMLEMGERSQKVLLRNLFHHPGVFNEDQMSNSYYKNITDFNTLKERIPNTQIDYIVEEFMDFPKALKDKKADLIMLSNVGDYIDLIDFSVVVKHLYSNNLKSGGKIQVYYNFAPEYIYKKYSKKVLSNSVDNNANNNSYLDIFPEYEYESMAYKMQQFCKGGKVTIKEVDAGSNYINIDGICVEKASEREFNVVEFLEKEM